jgi:hypothetical protein
MSKHRAALALSMTALAVAVLGQTAIGNAAVGAVRVALFAQNSGRVNNLQASRTPVPGRLLALDAKGQFPSTVLPAPVRPINSYTRTIVVHPDPDPLRAGTLLLQSVNAIGDNEATNSYLVKIEPGTYDLSTGSLNMRPYVDVEGSGEAVTILTSATSSSATVVGADNSELRFLTVKNTGAPGQQTAAIFSENNSSRFTHVTATGSGGFENYGIRISNGTPVFTNVTATATGGSQSFGVANYNGVISVVNSSFSASNASGLNAGLVSTFGGSVRAIGSTATASGGAIAIGMRAYNGSHTLANMTISGTSASGLSYGIYAGQKSSTPTVNVHQSRVSGQTNSIYSIGGAIRVGASQLSGPAGTFDIGTMVCASSYDAAFNSLSPACS